MRGRARRPSSHTQTNITGSHATFLDNQSLEKQTENMNDSFSPLLPRQQFCFSGATVSLAAQFQDDAS
jgi:hypothetical protein